MFFSSGRLIPVRTFKVFDLKMCFLRGQHALTL